MEKDAVCRLQVQVKKVRCDGGHRAHGCDAYHTGRQAPWVFVGLGKRQVPMESTRPPMAKREGMEGTAVRSFHSECS